MTATDGQLLERFRRHHDEAAFAELVGRHGPMVLGVCRRLLQDRHAAEDAYQATFLVLVRNAASIRRPDALGSWLYGVAYRIAVKLQRSAARARVKPVAELPEVAQPQGDPVTLVVWRELQPLLDEELQQLPEKYRAPLVLCELEGKSNAAAALELGWPASSLARRLARARELLHGRLTRRGVALSSGLLFPLLGEQARASLPSTLVGPTVRAAALLSLGQSAALEGVSPSAAALAAEVARAMLMTRVKVAAGLLLVVGLLGTAVGLGMQAVGGPKPAPPAALPPPPADGPAPAAAEGPPPAQPDPVEELRQALDARLPDQPTQEQKQFRKANLEKLVQKLHQIGQLRQALALQEWKDQDRDLGPTIDGPVRKELADRLARAVRAEFAQGDRLKRLAAIALIGDMGITVRDVDSDSTIASRFTPDLAEQMKDRDPAISAAAARVMGEILPDPKIAVPALADLEKTGGAVQRRAAAEGLASLIRNGTNLLRGRSPSGVEVTREGMAQLGRLVVPAAGHGVAAADAEVRRLSLDTLRATASTSSDMVIDPRDPTVLPPLGNKLSREEQDQIAVYLEQLREERKVLSPLLGALGEQGTAVDRALQDPDPAIRVAACRTVEALGKTRLRLHWRDARMAPIIKKQAQYQPFEDALRPGLRAAVPELAKLSAAGDTRQRLSALYALETLETEAAPAVEALVKAAGDENSFIRWAAARALGKMGPLRAEQAVPALSKLLEDQNKDVRVTAAAALERYGPAAKSAAEALGRAISHKDVRTRQWAIQALAALGSEGRPAVPALLAALSDPEAMVRAAVVRALGRIAPAIPAVRDGFRKALNDPDSEVRQAASDALLLGK